MALQAFDTYSHTIKLILKLVYSLHLHFLVEHGLLSNNARTPMVERTFIPSSYLILFVQIDVVGSLVFFGVNVFDDGFLFDSLRNLFVIVFCAVNHVILMARAS